MKEGFSSALNQLKVGARFARHGWNGKGMFVFMVTGTTHTVDRDSPLHGVYPDGTAITCRPHMAIKNADGTIAVWVPSQTDLFADDWYEVD